MIVIRLIAISVLVDIFHIVNAQQCYPEDHTFEKMCKNDFSGVAVNSMCFFLTTTIQTWYESFAACRAKDGALAQLHSSLEPDVVRDYVRDHIPDVQQDVWLAGRKSTGAPPTTCTFPINDTYWYDDPSEDSKVPFNATWIRSKICAGDVTYGTEDCLCYEFSTDFVARDKDCASNLPALCQVYNRKPLVVQDSDTCLGEPSISIMQGKSLMGCAEACMQSISCRSFDFYENGHCHLFTWSMKDAPTLSNNKDTTCKHFSII